MNRPFRWAVVLAAAFALAPAAEACGGDGQAPCTTAPAQLQRNTHCDPGTFGDPRNGGECWSCDGWARTLNAVDSGAACSKAGYTAVAHASYVGKPRGFDCPSGAFYDPRNWGECWSCSGWNRTAAPVTAGDACSRAYPEETKAARFVKISRCSSGEFWDPRNGGECWTCPAGYNRNANPVTDGAACTAQSPCAAGNIEYGGACWTKGDCGYKDGRACTLGERIPSCNDGLKEVAGRCVPLRPGESAFLGAIGDWAKDVSEKGYAACEAAFTAIPKANTGNRFLDAEGECGKQMSAGFACEVTKIPGQVSGLTEMIRKTGLEWDRDPCAKLPPGEVRAACSVLLAVGRDAPDAVQCAVDSIGAVSPGRIDPMKLCRLEGEIAFTLAMMALGEEVAEAEEGPKAVLKLILKADDVLSKANDANELSEKITASAACRRVSEQGGAAKAQAKAAVSLPPAGGFSRKPGSLTYYRFSPDGAATYGGQTIGSGWDLPNVLPGGQGVLYTVTAAGDLLYYKHDAAGNWLKSGQKSGTGWNQFQTVVSGGDGRIYAVTKGGDLMLYQFDANGTNLSTKLIGSGWSGFAKVFAGGDGVLYAVTPSGDLLYYRHDAAAAAWNPSGHKIGAGWNLPVVVSAGQGRLYAVDAAGNLKFYRHDPSGSWAVQGKPAGTGWGIFSRVIASPAGDGGVYGVVK